MSTYNASDRSYSRSRRVNTALDPALQLLPAAEQTYSPTSCPIVGHARIAGRATIHRHCKLGDVWIDHTTGLALAWQFADFELRVRSIHYHPRFPRGTFRFAPPSGSRSAQHLANDPYYNTRLARGIAPPPWDASLLSGAGFRLADLRGRPALLVLVPDSCSDPACDVFQALERAYRHANHQTSVIWVDLHGTPSEARKIVRLNHITFPVVLDRRAASVEAWRIQGYPYWLLIDAHGHVIEARLNRQSEAELERLLSR
jgi:hypothetical protein